MSNKPQVYRFVHEEDSPSLEKVQELVGGYAEKVTLSNGDMMLVDEDGRMRSKPINREATALAGKVIVGNVVVLSGKAKWK